MKDKLIIWGENTSDERVLIAMQLRPSENLIDVWTFPDAVATEEFSQKMFTQWRDGKEIEFPEDHTHEERKLTVADSILPDDLRVKQDDLIRRVQTEWHFVVVSMKMRNVLDDELKELEENIQGLERFSKDAWEDLKGFWQKVQRQVDEKLLYRDHANDVRKKTDSLFDELKTLRRKADEEFREMSKRNIKTFQEALDNIDKQIETNFRFQPLFDELRELQRKFRDAKFTKEDRAKVWKRLDGAFKKVKAEKFGDQVQSSDSSNSHLDRRLKGIDRTMAKIKESIARDRRDLEHEHHRIATTDGQLEAQIRQAKIAMIEERLRSKENKLKEIEKSRESVNKKAEKERERQEKKAEQERVKKAEEAAKKKIAEQIAAKQKEMENKAEEIKAAAAAVVPVEEPAQEQLVEEKKAVKKPKAKPQSKASKKTAATEEEESTLEALNATLGDSFRDAIDTAKAVASVVGNRAGEIMREVAEEVVEEVEETIEKFFEEE